MANSLQDILSKLDTVVLNDLNNSLTRLAEYITHKETFDENSFYAMIHEAVICAAVLDSRFTDVDVDKMIETNITQLSQNDLPLSEDQMKKNLEDLFEFFPKERKEKLVKKIVEGQQDPSKVLQGNRSYLEKIYAQSNQLKGQGNQSSDTFTIRADICDDYENLKKEIIEARNTRNNDAKSIKGILFYAAQIVTKTISYSLSYAVGTIEVPVKTVINGIASVCKRNGKVFDKTNSITNALYQYADKQRFFTKKISLDILERAKEARKKDTPSKSKARQ
ncbi:MAG: hypothetical protein SFT93_03390 [Rickettsiaceae bacterium]|nr:hypothetical protein [Rickettsiaceae bacterium]